MPVVLFIGALGLAAIVLGPSCGSPEAALAHRGATAACDLVTAEDVSEEFGLTVKAGEGGGEGDHGASSCSFKLAKRDGRIVVTVTPHVEPFARHAFLLGSGRTGEPVRGLGDHASWSDNMLVVLRGATLYRSQASPGAHRDGGAEPTNVRQRHIALARRALSRLGQ